MLNFWAYSVHAPRSRSKRRVLTGPARPPTWSSAAMHIASSLHKANHERPPTSQKETPQVALCIIRQSLGPLSGFVLHKHASCAMQLQYATCDAAAYDDVVLFFCEFLCCLLLPSARPAIFSYKKIIQSKKKEEKKRHKTFNQDMPPAEKKGQRQEAESSPWPGRWRGWHG
ncbi:hypothetical protein C8034_v003113 [Colletotrichum sidae]|uniref:Uncharacterized protein n=1 Tax=Colletotrichum sidae TaxID=1347389 RepID=A0A4R8TAV1_9PEZI|nr:hypothetical protein C8034_v003113 [Colletotrichum sidae]